MNIPDFLYGLVLGACFGFLGGMVYSFLVDEWAKKKARIKKARIEEESKLK